MSIRVLALCGGIGGAKLALGMSHIVAPENLAILVNTGDDFEHLGLTICPDVDTVTYTLAGLNNTELGWGLAGETWAFMDQLKKLGGEGWFNLGDRDLALHVERTRRLHAGESLSAITADVAQKLGIAPALWTRGVAVSGRRRPLSACQPSAREMAGCVWPATTSGTRQRRWMSRSRPLAAFRVPLCRSSWGLATAR